MLRSDIINTIIKKREFKSYLEIGTFNKINFNSINIEHKVCVDPDPSTNPTYRMTSDEYFETFKGKFDIVFIDGLHKSWQVEKDIKNSLSSLNEGGIVVLHDCSPTTYEMQIRDVDVITVWTGDVWKAFVQYRKTSPYYTAVVDTDYGCGIIDTTRENTNPLNLELPNTYENMTYEDLVSNREQYLNLISINKFIEDYK